MERRKRNECEQIFGTLKWHQAMVASVHSNCSPLRGSSPSLESNQSPILSSSCVLCVSSLIYPSQ